MIRIKRLTQNNMISTSPDSRETNLAQMLTRIRDVSQIADKVINSGEVPQNIDNALYIGDMVYISSELLKLSYKLINYLSEVSGNYRGNEVFAQYAKDLDVRYTAMQGKIDQFLNTVKQESQNK